MLLMLSLVVCLVGCSKENLNQDPEKKEVQTQEPQTQETENHEVGFYTTDEDCFAIETKYGTLEYPEKWKELAKIEIVEAPFFAVKFSGKTASGDIPIFDLTFNGGDGYRLGSMMVDGEAVTIYVVNYTFNKGILNDEEYFNCCVMQEDVIVILQHLEEDYGFTFD